MRYKYAVGGEDSKTPAFLLLIFIITRQESELFGWLN